MINVEDYLAIVAAYIKRDGYVKSAFQDPTWYKALVRYEDPMKSDNIQITPQDEELAVNSIMYFLHQDSSTSSYVNNVRTIMKNIFENGKKVEKKDLPFLASAVQSYLKNQEFIKRKEQAKQERAYEARHSNYVGEVGSKVTFEVAKMTYKIVNSRFGEAIMYRFVDPDGNIFVWFTGKDLPEVVRQITGTVKAHNEFQGVKQTVLTRCNYR